MKTARRKIPDFILESLQDFIGKKIAGIMAPPSSTLQPQENVLITKELTISLYDATWGYLHLKSGVLQLEGRQKMDLDNHHGFIAFVQRNQNPQKDAQEHVCLPSYGLSLEYPEFIIQKIEIYGQSFQFDPTGKNIGKLLSKKSYTRGNVVVENDCLFVLYSEAGDQLVIYAEMGYLFIAFDETYKTQLLVRPFLLHINYQNPVMLELNYTIE